VTFKPFDFAKLEASMAPKPADTSPVKIPLPFPLNEEQLNAVSALEAFITSSPELFFVLEGPAGVGKTYCIKELVNRLRGRLVFTAPTNKATKVLRESVTTDGYKPECRTIYSLLGLRLEANGEIKELAIPEDPLDLTRFIAVVVDEGSMVNSQVMKYITLTAKQQNIKFIFMGDRFQLPPVKEKASPIWKIEDKFILEKVMRHDNQILQLATAVRKKQGHPAPSFSPSSDNDGGEGVWVCPARDFESRILAAATKGDFSRPGMAKALAWRNVRVDQLNTLIRSAIFDDVGSRWVEGDRLIMLEPARDFENEPVAHTDDEGVVTRVNVTYHPEYGEFKCYALNVTFDDNNTGTIWLLHEDSERAYEAEVARRAAEARANGRLWRNFWAFKESFHKARYAYAITTHRSQGSTYEDTYVDFRDILLNRERGEAFQCLYVGVTRSKKRLFLA